MGLVEDDDLPVRAGHETDLDGLLTQGAVQHHHVAARRADAAHLIDLRLSVDDRLSAAHVLDVGCGIGRHLSALASRHAITGVGVDGHATFLATARQRAPAGIRYVHGDYRELDHLLAGETFDIAMSMFSSIGHLPWDAERRLFSSIGRALRTGGRFVVHHENPLWYERNPVQSWSYAIGPMVRRGVSTFDARTAMLSVAEEVLLDGSVARTRSWSIQLYATARLEQLLQQAGMDLESIADTDGQLTPTPTDVRSYAVARKH